MVTLTPDSFETKLHLFYNGIGHFADSNEKWELVFGKETNLGKCSRLMHDCMVNFETHKQSLRQTNAEQDIQKLEKSVNELKSKLNEYNKNLASTNYWMIVGRSKEKGLAICRGIIKSHGGNIWAKSDGVNKGSKFFVEIPINGDESINTETSE